MRDDGQEARWAAAGRAPGKVRWFPDGPSGMRAKASPRVARVAFGSTAPPEAVETVGPGLVWRDPEGVAAMEAEAKAALLGRCMEGAAAGCAIRALRECKPGAGPRFWGTLGRWVGRGPPWGGDAGGGEDCAWRRREECEDACHRACMADAGTRCAAFAEATAASAFRVDGDDEGRRGLVSAPGSARKDCKTLLKDSA